MNAFAILVSLAFFAPMALAVMMNITDVRAAA